MRLFVGLTDYDWFTFHASRQNVEEINFWRPSSEIRFKALLPGELFLFKLHAPRNSIAGGGFFVRFIQTPLSLAWRAFGVANGADSLQALRERISRYRHEPISPKEDPRIGCIILGEPFFFPQDQWIPAPTDFSSNIVQGKGYEVDRGVGQSLWRQVRERLEAQAVEMVSPGPATGSLIQGPRFGTAVTVLPRYGQGAFRLLVTEAYNRRCAMTRERTLPVLEAAHIHPYSQGGVHSSANGILLRSDLHRLFDLGYVTVDPNEKVVVVSRRLKEDFENGRDYYTLHGQRILLPTDPQSAPSRENLAYHFEHVYGLRH
jgi:putative restriction endonuclease